MKLLLTNDDGIEAKGLRTLWEGLKDFAELSIVAPHEEQSGKGVSVTFNGPLKAQPVSLFSETAAWRVWGTPADCVKLALGGLLDSPPDLIVSGINHGSNAGRGIFHSGTAGCIIQGTLMGIPGIAFSHICEEKKFFPDVKKFLFPIVDYISTHPLRKGTFLNVTFPVKTIQGVKMARQGLDFWLESPRKEVHPEGHLEFYLDQAYGNYEEHPDSDIALLKAGFVTAVPLHINELTDHNHLEVFKAHFEKHFGEGVNRSVETGKRERGDLRCFAPEINP